MPVLCNHCDKPACVPVCPTGGDLQERVDGPHRTDLHPMHRVPVLRRRGLPLHGPVLQLGQTPLASGDEREAQPNARRLRAFEERHRKVYLLRSSIAEGAESRLFLRIREMRDGDYAHRMPEPDEKPARRKRSWFGDLDDPDSRVAGLTRSHRASRLQEELGTEPKVYYLDQNGGWDVNYNDGEQESAHVNRLEDMPPRKDLRLLIAMIPLTVLALIAGVLLLHPD